MSALLPGAFAPDFAIPMAAGHGFQRCALDGVPTPLREVQAYGSVLLMFFKTSCPTCQYALPFLDRLVPNLKATISCGFGGGRPGCNFNLQSAVAVCQDSPSDCARFAAEYGFSTPPMFDSEDAGFPISNAYGLTHVPTVFLIEPDGRIAHTMESWSKADVEEIAGKLGQESPFDPGEEVLPFRPG